MGKSKSKKSQPKRYPTPTDRYLIVTDPWGGVPLSEPNFFNNVTAWFELMFKSRYPNTRPSAIFYQWTNKNIIIEIPDHIEVEPYLGAHYCYIYEFDHRLFPIPASQGGWSVGYAAYTKIRSKFDVKEPYPEPLPAPISLLPYAKKLPPSKVLNLGQAPLPPLPSLIPDAVEDERKTSMRGESSRQPTSPPGRSTEIPGTFLSRAPQTGAYTDQARSLIQERSRSPTRTLNTQQQVLVSRDTPQNELYQEPIQPKQAVGSRTPASPTPRTSDPPIPSNNSTPPPISAVPKLFKKLDPYEQEEAAMAFLHTTSHTIQLGSMSRGASVKQELSLDETTDREDEEYKPSNELLEAFQTLRYQEKLPGPSSPKLTIKSEHDLDDLPDFDGYEEQNYQPSGEPPEEFSTTRQSGKVETDSGDELTPDDRGYMPSTDLLAAMASLPDGMIDSSSLNIPGDMSHKQTQIKPEPQDDRNSISTSGYTGMDRERSMTLGRRAPTEGRQLDPRVKREAPEPQLYPRGPRSGSRYLDSTKRMKFEQ